MERITKKMIEDGLNQNIIKPIQDGNGLICKIGDWWFFFGGHEFDDADPKHIPFDILVSEILICLDSFYADWDDYEDEYMYYYYYLIERIH